MVALLWCGILLSLSPPASAQNRAWSSAGTVLAARARVTFSAQIFVPGSKVVFTLTSTRLIDLGSALADVRGVASATVQLPYVRSGPHTIRASGIGTDGAQNVDLAIAIKPSAPPPWAVTRDQFRHYLETLFVVLLFTLVAVRRRRRRRIAATTEDFPQNEPQSVASVRER